ncbi:hypothetical protein M5K25_010989 [Dendrobium thyrsiflorum]|uniref:Uncharacterized protein n=1 Tax=Dendrobium thyrsiflorum TaxID=117978 RepID=A0ABD0V230_DENTH
MPFFLLRSLDTGVHALSNVFHVDVERISKRRPNEAVVLFVEYKYSHAKSLHFYLQKRDTNVNESTFRVSISVEE